MPPHFRTPLPVPLTPAGSAWPRRLVTLIRGALLLVIVLCAVTHAETEEAHGPMPAAATAPTAMPGGAEPHAPHGAHACASDAVVRTVPQALEQPLADAAAPAVAAAGAVALAHPLALRGTRRRRRPRNGRATLVHTSRWRI